MGLKIQGNDLQGAKIAISYRNTQGPCPKGFHIGSKDEWQRLITALTNLGVYNVNSITAELYIPSAYYLARSNGALEKKYGMCRFWTSTMVSNTSAWAWGIDQNPTIVFQEDKPGNAFSIRPFKDEPVIPDSSWRQSSGGLFKNGTLGLISIPYGNDWLTISDKNLGATNILDDGLYYQFGNNYGFSPSPSSYVTKKPTFSDEYGPQNPYNSFQFVRVSKGNNWFDGTCNDIWGGVNPTGSVMKVKDVQAIYIGSTKVRPSGWAPGANTIAYYKFDGNLNDSSGNGRNLSMYTGSFSYSTLSSGQPYCQLNTSAQAYFSSLPFNRTAYTVSGWCYFTDVTSSNQKIIMDLHDGSNYFPRFYAGGYNHSGKIGSVVSFDSYDSSGTANTRYYLVAVIKDNVSYSYINGNLIHSQSYSNSVTSGSLFLNGTSNYSSSYYTSGRISELILENKARTAQEVADYYNQTKSDYEPTPRQPGANTIAYLKLEQNTNDSSGKGNNGTGTNITYTTLSSGKKVASFNGSSSRIDFSSTLLNNGATSGTMSIWVYGTFNTGSNNLRVIIWPAQSDSSGDWLDVYASSSYGNLYRFYANNNTLIEPPQYQTNVWKLLTITFEGGNFNFYTNGVLYGTKAGSYNGNSNFAIGYRRSSNDRYWAGYMSDFIIENKARTAQEIADYYNQTKGDYGL